MLGNIMLGLVGALASTSEIRTTQIAIPNSTQHLAVHCIEPLHPPHAAVLFIHGATFPTRLASGYEFRPGDSWLAFVAAEGYLACGFDFIGFGASTRPAAMLEAPDRHEPVSRTP